MPTTLSNGVVVPSPGDQVPANGVQAFRDQGASVNAALGARALVGHSHAIADVTGLQSALDNAGGDVAWNDVTGKPATFPPATHSHAIADVTGLQAQIDALSFDTGERNITSLVNPDAGMIAGSVFLRRVGKMVQLSMDALVFTTTAWRIPIVRLGQPLLPAGFRPTRTTFFPYAQRDLNENHGDVRIDGNGYVYLYQVIRADNLETTPTGTTDTAYFRASALFPTSQAVPTTLPGTPA